MKNQWSDRNLFVKQHIPAGVSIVDFGCGNKEILDFCNPTKYLGIDLVDDADLKIDLNTDFELTDHYDLGLLLGVLEYVRDPDFTLSTVKKFANTFVILTLPVKKKNEWHQAFTEQTVDALLKRHFNNVTHFKYNKYILSTGGSQ
jgi:hypothetical protein